MQSPWDTSEVLGYCLQLSTDMDSPCKPLPVPGETVIAHDRSVLVPSPYSQPQSPSGISQTACIRQSRPAEQGGCLIGQHVSSAGRSELGHKYEVHRRL